MYTYMAKILIVEDDQSLRELYGEVLRNEGYETDEVVDAETAFEKIKDVKYNLILLDYKLPKMNGVELLKKIQSEYPAGSHTPILLLTNMGENTIVAEAITLGAKGYLMKADITPDQLLTEIKKYLS